MMTEPESKEPSPEALAFIEVLFYPHYPRRLEVGRALDAAIAAGAEGALRRQAEVRQPGEYESFDDSITREAVTRLAKELATEKASHEATRKELEAERCAHARTGTALVTMTRASDHMRIQWQELAALRKPLEGELARDVELVREIVNPLDERAWTHLLEAREALSRIEAALQAKASPSVEPTKELTEDAEIVRSFLPVEWVHDGGHPARLALARLVAALQAKGEPVPMVLPCPHCHNVHVDEGEWATRPHRTHQCQFCATEWRPANVHTVGMRALPNAKPQPPTETPEPCGVMVTTDAHARCQLESDHAEAETPEPRAIVVGLNPEGES